MWLLNVVVKLNAFVQLPYFAYFLQWHVAASAQSYRVLAVAKVAASLLMIVFNIDAHCHLN